MPKLIILGSSNAVPDENHENTHLALTGADRSVLIDCVGSPVVRLKKAGIDLLGLTDLFLTHFHPDHISGVPNLLMSSWLLGRTEPLNVYGLPYTLERLETLMDLFDWKNWPHFYPIHWHTLAESELYPALTCDSFRIFTSPVKHLIPNIGLRVEFAASGQSLAYSCDTEPCAPVERLAQNVDLLIHETAGPGRGHTSPAQAGELARRAGARQLVMIHYRTGGIDAAELLEPAQKAFVGPVSLAEDFMEFVFRG